MPRLLGIRFESIGHPDARLSGVTLNFTGADGQPCDSVIWLRNGGGKSSILNLMFSLLRPSQREFLGSEAEAKVRELRDYVLPEDVSTVCLLWQLDHAQSLLLTGVSMEAGRPGELSRIFFAIRMNAQEKEVPVNLANLPLYVVDEATGKRHLRRLPALREALARLDDPPRIKVDVVEVQRKWIDLLTSYGIDPEVFGYQLKMNRREGAADEIFRFASSAEFADFLLDMVLSTEDADQVSENLRGFRIKLKRRPGLLLEGEALKRGTAELRTMLTLANEREAALVQRRQGAVSLWTLCSNLDRSILREAKALEEVKTTQTEQETLRKQATSALFRHMAESTVIRALLADVQAASRRAREEQARRDLTQAKRQLDLLLLATPLSRLFQTRHRERTLRDALAERLQQSAPLLHSLKRAAASLCQTLDGEILAITTREELLDRHMCSLAGQEETLRNRKQEDRERIAAVIAEVQNRRETVSRVESRLQKLREEGICKKEEPLPTAQKRYQVEVQELDVVEAGARSEWDAIQETLAAATQALAIARAQAQALEREADQEARHLREAEAELFALRDTPLLQEIVEDPEADLLKLAETILSRITTHVAKLSQVVLDDRVEGAQSMRALDALEQRELLPPSLDTERVQRHLRDAGISAFSGGAYLAHNATPERAMELIQLHPALCAGLVVDEEDLPRAASALRGAAISVEEPVAIGSSATLLAGGVAQLVVLPERALYDRGAAVVERERRRQKDGERKDRLVRMTARKEALEKLHLRLSQLLERRGPAWFSQQKDKITRLRDEAKAQRATATREEARVQTNREMLQNLERAAHERAQRRVAAETARARIQALREQGGDELATWRKLIEDAVLILTQAEQDLTEVEQLLQGLNAQRAPLVKEGQRLALERALLVREREATQADLGEEPGETLPLDEARQAYQTRRRLYEERTGGEALRGEIEATAQQAAALARELDVALAQAAMTLAEVASVLEEAQSTLGLPAMEQRARHMEQLAADALVKARADRLDADKHAQQANESVVALRRDGRSRLVTECQTRMAGLAEAALAQAADEVAAAQVEAQKAQEEAQGLYESASARRIELEEALTVARALRRRLEDMRGVLNEEPALRPIFAVEVAEDVQTKEPPPGLHLMAVLLAEQVDTVVSQVQKTERHVRTLEEQAQIAARTLASFAAHPAQAVLPQTLRDRLSEPRLDVLLQRVSDLLHDVELRDQMLLSELAEVDGHRQLLAGELLRIAEPALQLLRSLERASLFPPWVAGWGGEPFIRVQLREPESAAQREAVAAALLDQIVEQAEVPSGMRLIQRMVRDLTRAEGLSIQVVKPEAIRRRPHYESIEKLRSFSRGEQLTAAILLYCTLARQRAHKRGGRKSTTQVLILDNPIGTCSKAELVTLQRDMAAAHGVQLIYTTGVEDLEALSRLPNTIRLHNAHVDTRGRLHVTLGEASESVRVARIARREPRKDSGRGTN